MRRWSRETRLLVVTIALSVSVLLALARLRFPGHDPAERLSLPARPLQQLADRAVFDDLGAAVARVAARVRPALRVVALAEDGPSEGLTLADLLTAPPRPTGYVVAVHVGGGRFVALPGHRASIAAPAGFAVERRDVVRDIAVLAGPTDTPVLSASRPSLPAFLIVAEGTAAGLSVRPMFGSSTDSVRDPRWDQPVIAIGTSGSTPGALVFSLEGALVGGIVDGPEGRVLVPADALITAAARADDGASPRSLAVRVQRLDAALGAALGADAGVVVTAVDAHGPAAGRLEPGDVVRSIDGTLVRNPEDLLVRAALSAPGAPIDVEVVRARAVIRVRIDGASDGTAGLQPAAAVATRRLPADDGLGAAFVASPRGARVARVDPAGAAATAGLRAGDEVWWIQGARQASATGLLAAWKALPQGGHLALGVDSREPRFVAIAKP